MVLIQPARMRCRHRLDLWLQLLDYVKVRNTYTYRIFKAMHYSIYIRKVIKNNVIKRIIEEATRWVRTEYASEKLQEHLEKIKQKKDTIHAKVWFDRWLLRMFVTKVSINSSTPRDATLAQYFTTQQQ